LSACLTIYNPNDFHRRTVRAKPIGYDTTWSAVPLHRTLQKFERSFAIPAFRREDLKNLALMVHRAPNVKRLSIDPSPDCSQIMAHRIEGVCGNCPSGEEMLMTALGHKRT
jgi:hypothetical protein